MLHFLIYNIQLTTTDNYYQCQRKSNSKFNKFSAELKSNIYNYADCSTLFTY